MLIFLLYIYLLLEPFAFEKKMKLSYRFYICDLHFKNIFRQINDQRVFTMKFDNGSTNK